MADKNEAGSGGPSTWQVEANGVANCNPGSKTGNVAQNLLITRAYAKLYIDHPRVFKWAGMAAFASDMVGLGITSGKAIDVYVDASARSDGMWEVTKRLNATDLDNMLIEGNKAVYRDIYWQHLAYLAGGVDEVMKYVNRMSMPRKDLLADGWALISRGEKTNNEGLIWDGNTLLLKFEQMVTLQKVYDRYPSLSARLSYVMISPLPMHFAPFRVTNPGGNIGIFEERWKWIATVLVPEWRRLDAGSLATYVRLVYMGHFPKSIACFAD